MGIGIGIGIGEAREVREAREGGKEEKGCSRKPRNKDADLCVHKLPKACRLMIYTQDSDSALGM